MKADGDHIRLVRMWVAECCTADKDGPLAEHVLYPDFCSWALDRIEFEPVRTQFWAALAELGHGSGDGLQVTTPRPTMSERFQQFRGRA